MAQCPAGVAALEQHHRFGGKAGEGGEAAEEAGDDEQPPCGRQRRRRVEEAKRQPDQVAADQVGREGADLDMRMQCAENKCETPAQPGPEGGTEADGEPTEPAE